MLVVKYKYSLIYIYILLYYIMEDLSTEVSDARAVGGVIRGDLSTEVSDARAAEGVPLKLIILCHGDVINNIDSQGRKIDWDKNPSKYSRENFPMFDNMYVHFFSNHDFCARYDLVFAESICSTPGLIEPVETIGPGDMCHNYKLQTNKDEDLIYQCVGQNIYPFGSISNDLYSTLHNLYSTIHNVNVIHVYCLFCRGVNKEIQLDHNFGIKGDVAVFDIDKFMGMEMMEGGGSKKKTKKRKFKKSKHHKIKKSKTRNKRKNNKK